MLISLKLGSHKETVITCFGKRILGIQLQNQIYSDIAEKSQKGAQPMPKPPLDPDSPSIKINLTVLEDWLADVDEYAGYQHINRSEAIRDLVRKALDAIKEESGDHD